jgi:hypothetical protein
MKGFEIKVKNETVRIALNEHTVVSIIIQKHNDELSVQIGGLMTDTMLHYGWYSTDSLKLGDEVIITKKEIEQSSEPVGISPALKRSLEEKEQTLQDMINKSRELEAKLKEAGLID